MRKLFIPSLILLAFVFLSSAEAIATTYTTSFPLTENPISGRWKLGQRWNGGARLV